MPTAAAFRLREQDQCLSVNWLEYFDVGEVGLAIEQIQEIFRRKNFRLKRTGLFAVLGVGEAKKAVGEALGILLSIDHCPVCDDPSHAGIFGYGSEGLAVSVELKALVTANETFRISNGPD